MAKMTFESAVKQLEKIVRELEDGNQPLDTAMKKFEEGIKLSKFCSDKLDETEKKIAVLMEKENGLITEEPLDDVDFDS
ncbi:MAG: exodeoxyribonuclease VII small subunit [Desulfobacteraceae bacterium]|nr:exodeoxyribonuclease VII small subunit [Desulfobacteraceae bacterium]